MPHGGFAAASIGTHSLAASDSGGRRTAVVVVASGDRGKGDSPKRASLAYFCDVRGPLHVRSETTKGGGAKEANKVVSPAAREQGEQNHPGHHRRWRRRSSQGLGVSSLKRQQREIVFLFSTAP